VRRLFGTDGIRGVAGEFPLDDSTVVAIGAALAHTLAAQHAQPRVLLGMDTRESGPSLAAHLAAGLRSGGIDVTFAGVLPTPAVAFLTRTHGFAAGVVISASHNPWRDNGVKIFGADGYKLADSAELAIEEEIFSRAGKVSANAAPPLVADVSLLFDYAEWLRAEVPALAANKSLQGKRIVVDCANGAAFNIAPPVMDSLGAEVIATHAAPNGRNINQDCGALHPEVVAAEVVARNADLGITFDGDADRVLFATAHGKVVNGDGILLLAARALHAQGRLHGDTVVATTMSNMGLEAALAADNITMLRAPVGDKYVLAEMQKTGAALGGEQSGHIIFTDRSTTGDGLLTALVVLEMIAHSGQPLHDLIRDLKTFPQVIVNIPVREKPPLDTVPGLRSAMRAAQAELAGKGRVNVRYSGTEKLARVMVECQSESKMREVADHLAGIIRSHIGL
jgi:phosphoglucosamine mutase